MTLDDLDGLAAGAVLGAASSGLAAIAHLPVFFGGRRIVRPARFSFGTASAQQPVAAWLGWGNRRSGQVARRRALADNVPFALLEDGFIRSVGLGKTGAPPVSLVVDDCGMYYDASGPSRLENMLGSRSCDTPTFLREATRGMARWRDERLTKYNFGADVAPAVLNGKIVLVDQVRGDASVSGAGAEAARFAAMVDAALQNHSADQLIVLTHPDVRAGKARGYLGELAAQKGLAVLAQSLSPQAVLDVAAAVWTVSSGIGFEALLRNLPVTCFGMPFYAGWGLTRDFVQGGVAQAAVLRRTARPCVEAMFGAACLRYTRYADPVTFQELDFDGAVDRLLDWRERDRTRGSITTHAFGFSNWKRSAASAFLGGTQASVHFHRKPKLRTLAALAETAPCKIAVWGMTDPPGFAEAVRTTGHTLLRVEDGFLRSVGLGSDLLAPGSLVLDDLGLYYDARQASRLENILATTQFSGDDIARAHALRLHLCAGAMTKYNLTPVRADMRKLAGTRRVVLVAEQVPGDASLQFGGGDVTGNLALLEAVRRDNPDAFLVYKEHPDLVAGNRRGRLPQQAICRHADHVVSQGDMAGLFGQIDALHVMSSLAGFEALLRGVEVHVWGRPFYAGWGLTQDRVHLPRRSRTLTLEQLVAGTLIAYPLYADPVTHVPCSVEDFMTALAAARLRGAQNIQKPGMLGQARRLRRWLRAAMP